MLTVIILILAAIVTIGVILYMKYRTYTSYTVNSVIEMSNSEENTAYYPFGSGYLKCASDGVTYFNEERIVWYESYSMTQPVIDICGDYAATASLGQRDVYLYDKSGFINSISLAHDITDIEVSKSGMIAVGTNDGNFSYIEIKDQEGNEILTDKKLFSSSGFLMDLSLSEDGTKLAAIFVTVDKGTLKSKVLFYNLAEREDGSDIIVGTFDQYESVLLTNVQFMDDGKVCVIGDVAMSIYSFEETPELIYENLEQPWEIQALFFSGNYIGMVVEEQETESAYGIKVFDTSGNLALDVETDFSFGKADFAGENVILYSTIDCVMFSFSGIQKMNMKFDSHIEVMKSLDGRNFIYGTNSDTQFITVN